MEPAKRQKPGIARSLLHRVATSRTDAGDHDESPISPSSPVRSATTPITDMPPMLTRTQTAISNHGQQSSLSGPASIEQSVRMFRIYENLRKGDTAAILRDIKETTVSRSETGSPSSISAFSGSLEGTSILHLAVQCADIPVIEYVLSSSRKSLDINTRDKDGNTPLHVAAMLNRTPVVRLLLAERDVNDSIVNYHGRTPIDLAKNPEVFQQLQLARSMYIDAKVREVQQYVQTEDYEALEKLLVDAHFQSAVDVNGGELTTDPMVTDHGGTLLHEAARKRDAKLIQILLLNGADPFRRDRKGKLPQDITKDDRTKAILKKSPAAAAAQRGIQERTILGTGASQASIAAAPGENALAGKEGREMKGFLKKWVNYTTGYKLRWFVLEDGVLSYYKHQDDAGSACRGAINMKIAKLHIDAQDKMRFEIQGKSSVKYHLKANHQVEAKRWFWALNNAIQYAKDEAKETEKTQSRNTELLRQAKIAQAEKVIARESDTASTTTKASSTHKSLTPGSNLTLAKSNKSITDDEDGGSAYESSTAGDDANRTIISNTTTAIEPELDDEEDYGDDASSHEARPVNKDAFMIAAQSAWLQLELLNQISLALQTETSQNPNMSISEPTVSHALASYQTAVDNLKGLIGDLGRITRDREAYWHYRVEQEVNMRKVWEDNMTLIAKEQEELENKIGESEEKRKRTKRALRDALEGNNGRMTPDAPTPPITSSEKQSFMSLDVPAEGTLSKQSSYGRKKSAISEFVDISDSDSDDDEEFFDAVDAGKVEVIDDLPAQAKGNGLGSRKVSAAVPTQEMAKLKDIEKSYAGYEAPVRKRLRLDGDDRPKISLWGILKSMIGKDMTKMTLPVSFNEPTSLLQRVAEDMEYTDLLDIAADREDSTERMLYVAAFAASEYASTIGRVAKPFNPLLAETYEYVRPDKGYRFFVEQVSHHPPIGAAWTESAKWDYYGESAIKSKFYGKSFDINLLGTWFLRIRPSCGDEEELYTWKKVTSSVVGIITGNPTVDNYGPMEIKNHTTGEVCLLDFKQRGWKASSAYQVSGKVIDRSGYTRWSVGGRWNDKIYARLTPGYEGSVEPPSQFSRSKSPTAAASANQAFLVWEAHPRPSGIPFNLTPFVITLNALTPSLKERLPPTDTRLRPDQRAMEDGEYDFAATEKSRVEEKQRAKRRLRETSGEEFQPRWFRKGICKTTGESFWVAKGSREDAEDGGGGPSAGKGVEYWDCRAKGEWRDCEDIF